MDWFLQGLGHRRLLVSQIYTFNFPPLFSSFFYFEYRNFPLIRFLMSFIPSLLRWIFGRFEVASTRCETTITAIFPFDFYVVIEGFCFSLFFENSFNLTSSDTTFVPVRYSKHKNFAFSFLANDCCKFNHVLRYFLGGGGEFKEGSNPSRRSSLQGIIEIFRNSFFGEWSFTRHVNRLQNLTGFEITSF